MSSKESIRSILQREADAILNIPVTDEFDKAVALIVDKVHLKKGKLVTSGMGILQLHSVRQGFLPYSYIPVKLNMEI